MTATRTPVGWSAVAALLGGLVAIAAIVIGSGLAIAGVLGLAVTFGSAAWLAARGLGRARSGVSARQQLATMWGFSAAFVLLEWPFLALFALALLSHPSDWH
jgi:hypothetical protein